MPNNENPWTKELLSWHSHDRGGVHVPFQAGSNPLGAVIVTDLVQRLRGLANMIAAGEACPRMIFLIGGPGNGKSETVEDFLSTLDNALGINGALRTRLATAFAPNPLVRRRVEICSSDFGSGTSPFAERVGRLVVVQDATATDEALGDAAGQLANDILELLTTPETPKPVFVACTNRGLLSRAHKAAYVSLAGESDVTALFGELIRASSLGLEALKTDRPSCWPLQGFPQVACWPLDQESLITCGHGGDSPIKQMLAKASELPKWEVTGRCADCNSAAVCPFRQNAEWLRQATPRDGLCRILRHGELATGQRWNFRDAFSLAAELLVGEWDDFEDMDHPCKWVHFHAALGGAAPAPETIGHAYHLIRRLYPHALFPTNWLREAAEQITPESLAEEPFSEAFVEELRDEPAQHSKPIRAKLLKDYAKFDPAAYTPIEPDNVLYRIESEYSQSVGVGNDVARDPPLAATESRYLDCLKEAEAEWDLLRRDSAIATNFVHVLRRAACILVKRSVGVRLGHHGFEAELEEFEGTLRNQQKLNQLKDSLQEILGRDRFRFNLVESYGQPAAEQDKLVILDGPKPGLRTFVAPGISPEAPSHDVPSFTIGSHLDYRIPITFEFYLALKLRAAGCANSSLPASVRAAIDRVRHRYAGELCRRRSAFADETAQIVLDGKMAITLPDEESAPTLKPI
jgi:hypothetical protein